MFRVSASEAASAAAVDGNVIELTTSLAATSSEEKVVDMADFLSELLYMPHKAVSASGGTASCTMGYTICQED